MHETKSLLLLLRAIETNNMSMTQAINKKTHSILVTNSRGNRTLSKKIYEKQQQQ